MGLRIILLGNFFDPVLRFAFLHAGVEGLHAAIDPIIGKVVDVSELLLKMDFAIQPMLPGISFQALTNLSFHGQRHRLREAVGLHLAKFHECLELIFLVAFGAQSFWRQELRLTCRI